MASVYTALTFQGAQSNFQQHSHPPPSSEWQQVLILTAPRTPAATTKHLRGRLNQITCNGLLNITWLLDGSFIRLSFFFPIMSLSLYYKVFSHILTYFSLNFLYNKNRVRLPLSKQPPWSQSWTFSFSGSAMGPKNLCVVLVIFFSSSCEV